MEPQPAPSSSTALLVCAPNSSALRTLETRQSAAYHATPAPASLTPTLKMETYLPLNLRGFLLQELGSKVRIDDNMITAAEPVAHEAFMRELARAIRRFSFKRAQESWIEAVIGSDALEQAMAEAALGLTQVVLCLGCGRLTLTPDALAAHRSSTCLPVALHHAMARAEAGELAASALRPLLYQLIQSFRDERQAHGLPHFELDYYLRASQIVFTWQPRSG
ncbi:MAG TPA: hypothetical protein VKV28_05290 [Candidatus Binataceae bacterium]|nr:hypothetical protein [Candidatus Binataceae bacterium]